MYVVHRIVHNLCCSTFRALIKRNDLSPAMMAGPSFPKKIEPDGPENWAKPNGPENQAIQAQSAQKNF
jgi:hypothetical protein